MKKKKATRKRRGTLRRVIPLHVQETFQEIRYSLYDSFTILPGQEPEHIYLFQAPMGTNGKTQADTNMLLCGCLPMPQKFMVEGLRLDTLNWPLEDDLKQFLQNYTFKLEVGGRTYFEGLGVDLLRDRDWNCFYALISAGENFNARFSRQHPTALSPYGKGVRARLTLAGALTRPLF